MLEIHREAEVEVPEGVEVIAKNRLITVTGPRGELKRNFKHILIEISVTEDGRKVKLGVWHASRLHLSCLRTVRSHISNLITGVTKGFKYKMRFVYAHFPINVNVVDDNVVEIRNYLGEKKIRQIPLLDGVTLSVSQNVKDEIALEGNDLENVSGSCAAICQACQPKEKDIRK